MRNKLQAKTRFRVFSLTALLVLFSAALLSAQVPLNDSNPIEIRFTSGNGQVSSASHAISLADIESLTSSDLRPLISEWSDISGENYFIQNYYLSEGRQYISPGRIQISEIEDKTFFTFSLKNESEDNFGGMLVAFDLIYNKSKFLNHYNLRLQSRVNNAEWRPAEGGYFSTENLSESEDDWSTFSIQLNINELFLRNNDQIDLMWVFEGAEDIEGYIPLFMQRVEAHPAVSRQKSIGRGSVIITEIMPPVDVDGRSFEYLELYNPNNKPIELKGLVISSSAGQHVIQRNLVIDPYEVLVISNMDISDLGSVNNNYFYSGSIIPETGRIELKFNSDVIANATFEATDPGVSLYLDRALNAYDGYTSMRNLLPSEVSFFAEMYGSPGELANTLPVYKNTIEQSGWRLISLPGFLIERLSRSTSAEYFELNGERISPERIEPNTPVFIHKRNDEPLTIFVEEDRRNRQLTTLDSYAVNYSELQLASFSFPAKRSAFDGDLFETISPLVNYWDQNSQEFKVSFAADLPRDIWTPVFFNTELLNSDRLNETGTTGRTILDRYIPFSLSEGSSSQRRQIDSVVLGFLEKHTGREDIRFDLPTLATVMPGPEPSLRNHLYLTSEKSITTTNSFTHLPYELEDSYRIGLGTQLEITSSNLLIEWSLSQNIPDEWILTLEDTQTGTIVDMREVGEYRFRNTAATDQHRELERTETEISVLRPAERNRFFINIEPYDLFETDVAEEEELPGSVELRPNYPNPFNPSTNITFYLPEERPVRLGIYNIVGQQVALLMDDTIQQGEHSVVWDATNKPSGIYIVQLETGNRTLTRKITLIK